MSRLPYQLPVLKYVRIHKNGSTSGCFEYEPEDGPRISKPFTGSLPFSRLKKDDWEPFSGIPGTPDTSRMRYLEDCLSIIMKADPNGVAPVRFRTIDGESWKIDRRVLSRLIGSGQYELIERYGFRDFGIRQSQ